METRRLGITGLRVSRLGLGTMTWGHDTGQEEAAALLADFVDAGGNLVDTAGTYAGGHSERLLGSLIGTVVERSDLVISTKAALTEREPSRPDASRRRLLDTLDASLARLGVDQIDLWNLHAYDAQTPLEETLAAVDDAIGSGRVRYAAVAGYSAWQVAKASTWQRAWPGRNPIAAAHTEYSLLAREAERELLPACADLGVGVLAWSPLGRGVLTGKYRTGIPADSRGADPELAHLVRPYLNERIRNIVEAVSTAADGLGVSPIAVALCWVRDRPGITAPVLGTRTVGQLAVALETEQLVLPREIKEALDDVSTPARAGGENGESPRRVD